MNNIAHRIDKTTRQTLDSTRGPDDSTHRIEEATRDIDDITRGIGQPKPPGVKHPDDAYYWRQSKTGVKHAMSIAPVIDRHIEITQGIAGGEARID